MRLFCYNRGKVRFMQDMSERSGRGPARVLLVSHELSVTGAPNSLLRQAGYFMDAGFAVDVWSLAGGDLLPRYEERGLRPEIVADDKRALKAKYEANPVRYALVICNTIRTWRAVDVLRRYRLKLAWFVRETLLLDEDYWFNPAFAALFRKFYNLYTVSEYAADVVRRYNPRVRVVHNAVADRFGGFAAPADRVRFGFIGSFIAAKGLELLLAAFRKVHADFPATELVVAGGVPEDIAARLRAETAGDASVRWLGVVQGADKQRFFDAIDVLCVPSLDEPSGLTVIEGAMYGKAVVTTDHTGANYLVDDRSGRIVRAGDAASLEAALRELAALDAAALRRCGERSRDLYLKFGTVEAERAAVLRMPEESRPSPRVLSRLLFDDEVPWFHETHYEDGRRRLYFRNVRLLTLRGPGVRHA